VKEEEKKGGRKRVGLREEGRPGQGKERKK